MRFGIWAVLAASLAIAGAALAQPADTAVNLGRMTLGFTYFNRPGADAKTHDEAVIACAAQAAKTRSYDEQYPVQTSVVTSMISSGLGSAYHHGAVGANLENCMVARGWRVVSVPEAEGRVLAMLPQAELAARLAPWVGAQTPHGEIARSWRNDAALAGTIRYAFRPEHTNNGQLSLISATGHDLTQFTLQSDPFARASGVAYAKTLDKRWLGAALKPQTLASAPAEGGVIIAAVRGGSIYGAGYVVLNREGATPDEIASLVDHKIDTAVIGAQPSIFANHNGTVLAQAVPAGRWRLIGIGSATHGLLNFCLGSPSFEVKAGDVIYVGSFDFAGVFGPDMDLAPAKTWLAGQPQADVVKAAVYTNGATGLCAGSGIYAFEVPGAPFEPGYVGASIAGAQ